MAQGNIISTLKRIFPDIHFNIRTRINEDIKFSFESSSADYPSMEPEEHLYFVLRALEDDLRRAKKKLAKAIKLHKIGEITIEELQDHELFVYDLELEIDDINGRLNWY